MMNRMKSINSITISWICWLCGWISHLNDANNVENLNLFKALCLHEKCFDAGSLEISRSSNFVKYLPRKLLLEFQSEVAAWVAGSGNEKVFCWNCWTIHSISDEFRNEFWTLHKNKVFRLVVMMFLRSGQRRSSENRRNLALLFADIFLRSWGRESNLRKPVT